MYVMSLVVVLLVTVLAMETVTSCNPPSGRTNGCSIPFGLPYFYKNVFTPDCHKHDICYACGEMRGRSRSYCDKVFYNNIKSRCRDSRVRLTQFCRNVAFDYYAAVRLGGWASYKNPSPNWCEDSWVSSCL